MQTILKQKSNTDVLNNRVRLQDLASINNLQKIDTFLSLYYLSVSIHGGFFQISIFFLSYKIKNIKFFGKTQFLSLDVSSFATK